MHLKDRCVATCPVLPCFAAMWRAELPWASTASMRTEFRMRNSQAITLPDKMLWWIAALLSSLLFLQRHFKINSLIKDRIIPPFKIRAQSNSLAHHR